MVVKIRLARLGCINRAFYRIVAADSHTPRDGKHLRVVGFYDPLAAKGDARRLGLNVDLVLVLCRCSAYRHRAWHSYESWFNIATTDGCYGAEKGTSW